ncbi:T9SS type B sorting domain-containing protein [Flavobacterium sp. RHBU_24]|uniref:T9SS type B sorting domain-containing protein n=1 Tax=Flavobacterium sp. RHBU_24 TaxID=3391185 RepID=UPI0039850A3B
MKLIYTLHHFKGLVQLCATCLLLSVASYAQENCNNGIDDDGDGKIDLIDPDCACGGTTATSFINNYNFEQMSYCPNNFALFDAATSWFLPNNATSDYINSCGFVPVSATDAGVYPLPEANGTGVSGILVSQDYKEYIATCLNNPLIAGTVYQLNFDIAASTSGRIPLFDDPNTGLVCNEGYLNAGNIKMTLYGKSSCNTTPEDTHNTPEGWVVLGTASYLPTKNWSQLSVMFTPTQNISSIMLGAPEELPDSYVNEYDYHLCFPYFYFDNLILNTAANLGIKINSTGSFCDNSLVLNASGDSGSGNTYQWYKDGIAIAGAINSVLPVSFSESNTGNYTVMIINAGGCKISPFYNVNKVIDQPEYIIDQSPCFPGNTTITITTPADQYSFDGGLTWSLNPSDGNYTSFDIILIAIKKNGCVSSTRNIVLTYPPLETIQAPEVEIVQPGCHVGGSITVTSPATSYSFDDGITWTTNPTLSNLPPNPNITYKVKIKTPLGCTTGSRYIWLSEYFLPEPEVTSTSAGCGTDGTITITTPAALYSINYGATWSANPVFTNLAEGSYTILIKNDLGCVSQGTYVGITKDYLPKPDVLYTQAECGTLGSIIVTTLASEYSFDNGNTWSTNNTASNLQHGYYSVIIKNSQGCTSLEEVVYLQEYFLDTNPAFTAVNPSCANNGSITFNTSALEYSIDDGSTWQASPVFLNLAENYYYLKIRNGVNCESATSFAYLQDFNNIAPNVQMVNAGCNTYGSISVTTIADLYSFDNGATWQANNSITNLSGSYVFNIIAKNINNCATQAATIYFDSYFTPGPAVNNYTAYLCDISNDGNETALLADYNPFLAADYTNFTFYFFVAATDAQNLNLANQISNTANYPVSDGTVLYTAVVLPGGCHSVAALTFSLLPSPAAPPVEDNIILCENSTVTVSAGNGYSSYLWSSGATSNTVVLTEPGSYYVTVATDYGTAICEVTKSFEVILSNPATITDIITEDFKENNSNVIEIIAEGSGDYEYSLDGILYQQSNVFTGLASGIYTAYVRDKNDCGIINHDVFLLTAPNFFTPNGDNNNDTWDIKFSYFEPGLIISIFDRYGKLIKQLSKKESWDGTYNGNELPADDYWFLVTRNNGRKFGGHFSLIR